MTTVETPLSPKVGRGRRRSLPDNGYRGMLALTAIVFGALAVWFLVAVILQAKPAFAVKPGSIERDDAGGFLAAVLQSMQAERGDGGGFGVAEDAEHAAFLAQRIAFEV